MSRLHPSIKQATRPVWRRLWSTPTSWIFRHYPGLAIVPLVFFVAAAFQSAITSGPIICIFRLGSGIPCAGCGMTRGFVAIAHGHPTIALQYNLLSPIAFGWMLLWWLMAVARLLRGKLPPAHPAWLIKTALAILSAYWLIRAGWFIGQPGAWRAMVDTSPLLQLLTWLWP